MRTSGERPILFSGEMVRALLAGTKTQTRRIIKCPPSTGAFALIGMADGSWWPVKSIDGESLDDGNGCETFMSCPFGKPRDRLWVRESYYQLGHWESLPGVKTKTGRMKWRFVADSSQIVFDPKQYDLTAISPIRKGRHHLDPGTMAWHKRLGRFMPRKSSRTTLEITEVRVQRLQEVSNADAMAEGIGQTWGDFLGNPPRWALDSISRAHGSPGSHLYDNRTSAKNFALLWESIHGVGAWDANPWVWAVSFKVVDSGL